MPIDEELLKPIRELLTRITAQIKQMEAETIEKVQRYPDDRKFEKDCWREFYQATAPLRREQEAIVSVIVDYYAAQPRPPQIISHGQ